MALAVLSDTQARAVEYVIKKSKVDSERRYPELKSKVERLGYSEKDLERYCVGMDNGICCVVCSMVWVLTSSIAVHGVCGEKCSNVSSRASCSVEQLPLHVYSTHSSIESSFKVGKTCV